MWAVARSSNMAASGTNSVETASRKKMKRKECE
jgi:hypothetical protein